MTDGTLHPAPEVSGTDTGDVRVDGLLTALDHLADRPVQEHADIYLALHAELQGALDPDAQIRRAGAHGTT